MARARLRDRHQDNLRKKLEVLKAEQAVAAPIPAETSSSQSSTTRARDKSNPEIENQPGVSYQQGEEEENVNDK